MTGINRVGQKVQCVSNDWLFACSQQMPVFLACKFPAMPKIYTVTGFDLDGYDRPGIHVKEIESVNCPCRQRVLGWTMENFRPVVEDGKKFDAVTEIIEKSKRIKIVENENAE